MYLRHRHGKICELILSQYLYERGFWVFTPIGEPCPADIVAMSPDGDIFLFDSKKEMRRTNPGRKYESIVYRKRTDLQKSLGIRMAYINLDTRAVTIVPKLPIELNRLAP